jgi:membrane protease subunit HflC
MNRLIIIGIAVVAILYVLFSSLYVVNEREQAIVMRFGQITDVRSEPGIYFKVPTSIVDSVQIIEDRLLRADVTDMRVQVSGGAFYQVDAFLTYRIADARLFRERALGELSVAEDRIITSFAAVLRQVYGLREFNAALSEQRSEMMTEAANLIRPDLAELGIQVVDVRILRTDLAPDVFERTYERMRAERLAEAALLRARGQELAQSLRAIADRQAVEIVAEAQRDSEIVRGEGDALRSEIFAQAYMQDPEFFEFYRSLESYRAALGESGTTMVLSPDSEFFQYFGSDPTTDLPAPGELPPAVIPEVPESATSAEEILTPPVDIPANEPAPAETPAPAEATPAPAVEAPAAEAPATEVAPAQ